MTRTPFHLPIRTAIEVARKSANDGTLQALQPSINTRQCLYRLGTNPGCGCAIGRALPSELVDTLYADKVDGEYVDTLIRKGYVSTDNTSALIDLQWAHDSIVDEYWRHTVEERKALFLRSVDKIEAALVA